VASWYRCTVSFIVHSRTRRRFMLKRIRDLFGRRDRKLPHEVSSPPGAGDDRQPSPPESAQTSRPEPRAVHRGPNVVHHPIPVSDLDPEAVKILRRLTRFDHTAYLVGGCVRDLLLDRSPKDFDIATSATPRQVKRLFSNCRIIGRRFRLAHIYFQDGKIIEVATFRARDDAEGGEAGAEDDLLIRDDNVFGSPEEDALRRDFTINALFYDVNAESVIDHADGLGDLRRRLVRTIGEPGIRFREDPIRILRAVKFAARLGFGIEPATLEALRRLRTEIPKAASARVLEEIHRFCRAGSARASFELMGQTGVFDVVLPEIAEAYRPGSRAWGLLLAILARLDERHAAGQVALPGEIFAGLLVPALAPRLGWQDDGSVVPPRGAVNVREMADGILRPIALRLRIARRDQETCRQILMTIHRMIPVQGMRRGIRDSIARRPCFAEALWILEAAAAERGGDLVAAAAAWRECPPARREPVRTSGAPAPDQREESRPQEERDDRGGRRRRRRPRRRSGEERPPAAPAAAALPPRRPAPPRGEAGRDGELPPPWDDRYFFAALPNAGPPDPGAEPGDRYGAASVAAGAAAPDGAPEEPAAERRRRPRPRRRRKRGDRPSGAPAGGESPGPGEPSDPSEP
jgi:poly(A) polymerase